MATRNEKLFGSLAGAFVGGLMGYLLAENSDVKKEDRWKYILGGATLGGVGGYGTSVLLGSKNDTVNYQLYNKNNLVYQGITYDHRIDNRKLEHKKSGKIFDEMIIDTPKPRVDAIKLEKKMIQRDQPKYNIQHNR